MPLSLSSVEDGALRRATCLQRTHRVYLHSRAWLAPSLAPRPVIMEVSLRRSPFFCQPLAARLVPLSVCLFALLSAEARPLSTLRAASPPAAVQAVPASRGDPPRRPAVTSGSTAFVVHLSVAAPLQSLRRADAVSPLETSRSPVALTGSAAGARSGGAASISAGRSVPFGSSPASSAGLWSLRRAASPSPQAEEDDDAFEGFRAKTVALFPGQGAQAIGMGVESARQSAAARALFKEASEVVGRDLLKLCEEGPEAELHQTSWAQPALLTASMAAVARWKEGQEAASAEPPRPDACLGLSLGEYSALCFAEALSFPAAVHLTRQRGLLMQKAGEKQSGSGMVAVLGLSREQALRLRDTVQTVLRKGQRARAQPAPQADTPEAGAPEEVCVIANYLCPGNYAFSGTRAALDALEELATKKVEKDQEEARGFPRAKRVVRLKVSGAFHSCLMQEAAEGLRQALETTEIRAPKIPVVMNVDARPHASPRVIKENLMRQLTNSVLMDKSLEVLVERGMQEGLEFGPGAVLAGLMKKTSQDVKVHQVA
ncbi:acyl transferase domain-containing protein [Besnoitia besnoiti]|uniref:Acyl transferase domain-containing protein n=1 Tax=Besnoitia besnoiti TaxID=94643 RepID=A0A2A9M9L0_BESBE|nr:acyl transferase domain-containing protein [Besnoitia besnoiti]PFH35168.1 acyl transferase domain-containing protein [Besnoitia besnoiti]